MLMINAFKGTLIRIGNNNMFITISRSISSSASNLISSSSSSSTTNNTIIKRCCSDSSISNIILAGCISSNGLAVLQSGCTSGVDKRNISTTTNNNNNNNSLKHRTLVTSSKPHKKSATTAVQPDVSAVHHNHNHANNDDNDNTTAVQVPKYLNDVYWWAYTHPNAVKVFERQWLVDLILWGNFNKLRDAALQELCTITNNNNNSNVIDGKILQIACVYGNFTEHLARRLSKSSTLDIVDVAPVQIDNMYNKLLNSTIIPDQDTQKKITIKQNDATKLSYNNETFDQIVLFFLLHEMPENVRIDTLNEAFRVLKPNGKMVIVDYHKPTSILHPHRYIMPIILQTLEPYAMDLWKYNINKWLLPTTNNNNNNNCHFIVNKKELYFGGLYQKVIIVKE